MRRNARQNKRRQKPQAEELVQLTIHDVGAQGDGIADKDGQPVFVPMTMAGDVVEANLTRKDRNGQFAELRKIITPSPDRVEKRCAHFGKCGGCQLQMLPDAGYRDWVQSRTIAALAHHGFDASLVRAPMITPSKTRRRTSFSVLKLKEKVALGFKSKSSNQIVEISDCPVTHPAIMTLVEPFKAILQSVLKDRASGSLFMTVAANGVDILIDIPHDLSLEDRENLAAFADKYDVASLQWSNGGFADPVAIRRQPMMNFAGCEVPLPPAAFIQATKFGEEALLSVVMEAAKGHKRAADLFAGIGTFSFAMARECQVLAVEGAKAAIDALHSGVNRATGLKKTLTAHRDLFRRPLTPKELEAFDLVLFDPPRAGAKDQAEMLARSRVRTVIAVSCNPNTFSRDARILVDGGYTLQHVTPVDQFLWSPHVELVGVFTRPVDAQ